MKAVATAGGGVMYTKIIRPKPNQAGLLRHVHRRVSAHGYAYLVGKFCVQDKKVRS